MESLGQKLREERQRLSLTLEQVSATTRISLKSLKAIEDDRGDEIGSAFLYKSFVRQFASAISLRYADISVAVLHFASLVPEPKMPGQTDHIVPKVPPLRRATVSSSKWAYSVGALVIVLASCSTLNGVWHGKRFALDSAVNAANPIKPNLAASKISRTSSAAESPRVLIAQPRTVDEFHVQISASQPTWLSITSDGKTLYSSVLQSGETRSIEGHQLARVRTGNAAGVSIQFNGKPIGLIGSPGQVRTVVFTKNKYEIVAGSSVEPTGEPHFRESGA